MEAIIAKNETESRFDKISKEIHDMGYDAAKKRCDALAAHAGDVLRNEIDTNRFDVHAEWNGDVHVIVDVYYYLVSLTMMIDLESAEDDEKITETVARQLREFDGREYIKEEGDFLKETFEIDDYELTGRVWDAEQAFHEAGEWM